MTLCTKCRRPITEHWDFPDVCTGFVSPVVSQTTEAQNLGDSVAPERCQAPSQDAELITRMRMYADAGDMDQVEALSKENERLRSAIEYVTNENRPVSLLGMTDYLRAALEQTNAGGSE